MSNEITLENGCVKKLFFKFAIPSILGMLIVSMQIMIDGIFLSKGVGPNGLAAVNISMPLINTLMSTALMICIGGGVLVGITRGENKHEKAKSLTTLTLCLFFGVLLILSLLILFNITSVIKFLGANDVLFPYVKTYLSISIGGSIFFNMPIFTETFVRIAGKPNQVFISGLICFLGNVILDYIFILRLGMGMEGAAIATCFANMFGSLVLLPHIEFGKFQYELKEIKDIFYNGSSEMLTTISSAFSTYLFNIIIMKQIGVLGVSALTIVFYINTVVNISLYGLSQALQPIVSYNVGAKRIDKIKDVLKIALISGGTIGLVTFICTQLFSDSLINVFSDGNKELNTITNSAIFFFAFAYLLSFINIIASSFHTSIEKPLESALIACGRSIIFVVIPLLTLPFILGDVGIWIATPIAELICLLVSIPLTLKSIKTLSHRFS